MEEGLLSLKWNNHRGTFLHILTALRDKPLHSDVTLACGGSLYPVHKLVLSACSSYFESIFASITCQQPVIVLKDIRSEDLEALLDYMYAGEVEVKHSSLASLIKAAECLCIKGLAVPDGDPSHTSTPNKTRASNSGQDGNPKRRKLDTSGLGDVQDSRKSNQNSYSSRFDSPTQKAADGGAQVSQNNQRNNGEVAAASRNDKDIPLQRSRHKRSLAAFTRGDSSFTQNSGDISDASCDNRNSELRNNNDKIMTEAVVKVELEDEDVDADQTPEDMLIEKTETAEYEETEESTSVSGPWRGNQDGGDSMSQDGIGQVNQDGGHPMSQDGGHLMSQDGGDSMCQDGADMNEDDLDIVNQHNPRQTIQDFSDQRIQDGVGRSVENIGQKIQDGAGRVTGGCSRPTKSGMAAVDRSLVESNQGSRAGGGTKETQVDSRLNNSLRNEEVFDASSDSFASAELEAHLSDEHDLSRHEVSSQRGDDDVSILRDDTSTVPDSFEALRSMGISVQNNSSGMVFIPPNFSPSRSLLPVGFNSKSRLAQIRKSHLTGAGNLLHSKVSSHFLSQDESLIPKVSCGDPNLSPGIRSRDDDAHLRSLHREENVHPTTSILPPGVMPGVMPSQSVMLDDLRSSLPSFEPPTPARKDSSAEDPLHCPFCGKLCKRRDHLRLHMRIHTGEKPFKCPYCDRRTNQKNNLKLHIRNVHPGLPVLVSNTW